MYEKQSIVNYISDTSALFLGANAVGLLKKLIRSITINNKVTMSILEVNKINIPFYPPLSVESMKRASTKLSKNGYIEYSKDRKTIYIDPSAGFKGNTAMLNNLLEDGVINYEEPQRTKPN